MIGSFRAAWMMLTRPALAWPALAAVVLFSVMSISFTFSTAAAPGGSRLSDPPTTLDDLAGPDAVAQIVGRPVMVTGLVVLAVSILHVTSQYSSGFIRVQFVRQPQRSRWLLGNWAALACAAAIASVVGAVTAVATAILCATMWDVDTSEWSEGFSSTIAATGNLTLGMIAFALVGSALGFVLRSSIAALTVGLVYALFENLINAVAPFGQGLLPASAFTTVATSVSNGYLYTQSLAATIVLCTVITCGTISLVTNRNVTE